MHVWFDDEPAAPPVNVGTPPNYTRICQRERCVQRFRVIRAPFRRFTFQCDPFTMDTNWGRSFVASYPSLDGEIVNPPRQR